MDHRTDREGTDEKLAQEAEAYREEVSKGAHGAHKPCEKFPIEEAQEEQQRRGTGIRTLDRRATHQQRVDETIPE
jgi:hypothetical protein